MARPRFRRPAALRHPRGRDPLGLRQALPGLLLPAVALAMTLLAALALGGAAGAQALAGRWQQGAAAAATVQLPDQDPARLARALATLRAMPEVAEAEAMDQARLATLLRPWLGEVPALPLPALVELRLDPLPAHPEALAQQIQAALPGAVVETQGVWVARLVALAQRVQQAALAAVLLLGLLAVGVVVVGIQAGLAARQDVIGILHDLGATDADIANRYAGRVAWLCGLGALGGLGLAVPALLGFGALGGALLGQGSAEGLPWAALPWPWLAGLPPLLAALGWLAATGTVRHWLRRLP